MIPINGGRVSIQTADQIDRAPQVISEVTRRLFGLQSRDTEWIDGNPIYDRLPSVSEKYRIHPEDSTAGRVFIGGDRKFATGPGSLQVALRQGNNLQVNSGVVSWPLGTTNEIEQIVDITILGLESSRWFIGYELNSSDEQVAFRYLIDEESLGEVPIWEATTSSEVCGNELPWAFLDRDSNFFQNQGNPIVMTFSQYANFTKIRVPVTLTGTPSVSPYITTNLDTIQILPYFDSITSEYVWNSMTFTGAIETLTFVFPTEIFSIRNILFSGEIDIVSSPENPIIGSDLVIYNISDPEVQTSTLCLLAYFETNTAGQITSLRDIRIITEQRNDPVAQWLTSPIDRDLRYYYDEYANYADRWMNPEKAGMSIYSRELDAAIFSQ